MEKSTKKIIVIGTVTIVGLTATILATRFIIRKIKKSKADKDKGENLAPAFDPATQYKVANVGTYGFVNVRSSTEIPEQMNYLDWLITPWEVFTIKDNLLGKVKSNPIGKIINEEKGSDGYTWYQVQLSKPLGKATKGWVREDAIKIQIKNK